MFSRLDNAKRKMIIDKSFNFIMNFNFRISGRSLQRESYKESLNDIRKMLSALVEGKLLDKNEAASFIGLLTLIRRHDLLRLNLTKHNLDYAFDNIASAARRSRVEFHKLCIVMMADSRIRNSISPANVFQILDALHDSQAVTVFDNFISDMSDHVMLADACLI